MKTYNSFEEAFAAMIQFQDYGNSTRLFEIRYVGPGEQRVLVEVVRN